MDLKDGLYPKAPASDPKWGAQQFADPDYVPIPLDSQEAAMARMLASLEAGDDEATACAKALNGADEAGTVKKLLGQVAAERAQLLGLNRSDKNYEAKVAETAQILDKDKWLAARPKVAEVAQL